MSFEENFKESLKDFLVSRGIDAVEVTDYEDTTMSDGYCDTCYYEWAAVKIQYRDSQGKYESFIYNDGFSDLIRELA